MKRLLLPVVLAAGVLAASSGDARAHGGAGFGFGFGIDITVNTSWWWNSGGANGCPGGMQGPGCGGCCPCVIPGWSPYYNKPTMFSGMTAAGYTFNPAPIYYGPFPYQGGYDAVGYVPARPPVPPYPPGKLIEKKPKPLTGEKIIEKVPVPKVIENGPPAKAIEGGAPRKD
jgi:hypothetical protein